MNNSPGPRTGTVVTYLLYAVCLALLAAELLIHREVYFGIEGWYGFYAILGFAAYCGIIYTAKALRRLVRRPEDYYDGGRDG